MIKAAWQDWVGAVVTRYPQAAAIEVWNEANMEWAWIIEQDPELYGLLVKATTEAVHALAPSMRVLGGGMAGYYGEDTPDQSGFQSFLSQVFEAVGPRAFDAISYHSYPCGYGDPEARLERDAGRIRAIKGHYGRPQMGMWVTESGATSSSATSANCGDSFTEAEQGPALQAVVRWARRSLAEAGDVHAVVLHSLFNETERPRGISRPTQGKYEYGLIAWAKSITGSYVFRDKPAFNAVSCVFNYTC